MHYFSKVLIDRCNFSNNLCTRSGGAIYCSYAHPIIQNSSFSNNIATYGGSGGHDGGALFFVHSGSLVINNLIYNNSANSGGGVYVVYGSTYNATFVNNTIINNTADYDAGGVRLIQAEPSFKNTIIYGNTAPTGSQLDIWGSNYHPEFYYCNIEGGMAAINGSGFIGDYENCIDADPQFTGSGDHPYDLLDISPCINTGDPAITTNDVGEFDLTGDHRIFNGIIDIGAYETFNPAFVDNLLGTALDFDGTDDYVEFGNNSSLNLVSGITVELWTKPRSMLNCPVLNKGNVYWLHWDNNYEDIAGKGYQLQLPGTNSGEWEFHKDIEYDNWYHIAWTLETDGILTSYVNGELTRQGMITGTVTTNTNNLIFAEPENTQRYNGNVDEIRIWDVVRSTEQIRENMHLPLAGTETGLVSWWQFNDGSETKTKDAILGNNGTLFNMTNDDWIDSSIPFGEGISNTQTEIAGTIDFTGTGLSMFFNSQTGASVTVTGIDTIPNINPANANAPLDSQYWVVNRFGSDSFNADLTFTVNEDLTIEDEANPNLVALFTRASTADANWVYLTSASSVDAATDKATFEGITEFSQFIIGKGLSPDILVETDSLNFGRTFVSYTKTDTITINNNGADTLFITNFVINNPDFSVDITNCSIVPSESYDIGVSFSPSTLGTITDTLTITSNDPDEPTVKVVLTGEGLEPDAFPGTALDFDGTDDYIDCGNDTSLNITGTAITIEAWIYPTNFKLYSWQNTIVGKDYWGAGSETGFAFRFGGTGGDLSFVFGSVSGWVDIIAYDVLILNMWQNVAVVYNGSSSSLYVNGEIVASQNQTNAIFSSPENLCIGQSPGDSGNREMTGKMDEIRLWNTARTIGQIRKNMHLPLAGAETGLISYWQFNEESGTILQDLVSDNNGTLNNMNDNDWIGSTIPFGEGVSNTQTETTGTVDFTGTRLSMFFNSQNGAEITVTKIDTPANMNPVEADTIFDSQYWVVNRFGIGAFDTDLTFTVSENLTSGYEDRPFQIKLYTRSGTADTDWVYLTYASSVDAINNKVTFEGITGFSQFIVGWEIPPDAFPGTALDFDGTDDYVETTLNDLSGSEITIEYWFKGNNTQSAVRQQNGNDYYIVSGWFDTHILSNDGGA
ncbi:MAG: choice-of-anchor D domain-containing protein, partial [Candidatus Cloacimonetes bacterium]|nr:choice-of-anchor D domain-containing protein [Candidatus Cloacimonadota bacterium]